MSQKKRDTPPPSTLSVDLSVIAVSMGLPAPTPEYPFKKGRKWALDWAWPDYKVALEKQGATFTGGKHTRGVGYRQDAIKLAEAQLDGWLVVFADTSMLQDGLAWSLVRRALLVRGWESKD